MTPPEGAPEVSFADNISAFIRSIECKAALTKADREQIYRLRRVGYVRAGVLPPSAPEMFTDRFDESENGKIFGLYVEGRLAASIRVHVASRSAPDIPAMSVFPEPLQPLLDAGAVIVDPTRFVIEPTEARRFAQLPYATVRIGWMACEHYRASYVLATVRAEHRAFYRRLFGNMAASEPRLFPGISAPITMLTLDYLTARDRVHARYPFLASSDGERVALFGPKPDPAP